MGFVWDQTKAAEYQQHNPQDEYSKTLPNDTPNKSVEVKSKDKITTTPKEHEMAVDRMKVRLKKNLSDRIM